MGDDAHRFSPGADRVYAFISSSGDDAWEAPEPAAAPQGDRILFLFTDDCHSCGEIHTHDGAFSRAILTAQGGGMLEDAMHEWQTHGIPMLCRSEDGSCAIIERLIPLRDERFHSAATDWLGSQSIRVLDAPASFLGIWEELVSLPIEGKERVAEFASATEMDLPALAEWRKRLSKKAVQKKTTPRAGRRTSAKAGGKKRKGVSA